MEKVVLTQISIEEFREIIREEIHCAFKQLDFGSSTEAFDEILDVNKACQFLGVSKSTIYKKTSEREIPHSKVGKRLYFKRSELIEWISEGRQKTTRDIEMDAERYLARKRKFR
jgi:excisionase family DNA binding protein